MTILQNFIEVVVAWHDECTKFHWILYFKVVCYTNFTSTVKKKKRKKLKVGISLHHCFRYSWSLSFWLLHREMFLSMTPFQGRSIGGSRQAACPVVTGKGRSQILVNTICQAINSVLSMHFLINSPPQPCNHYLHFTDVNMGFWRVRIVAQCYSVVKKQRVTPKPSPFHEAVSCFTHLSKRQGKQVLATPKPLLITQWPGPLARLLLWEAPSFFSSWGLPCSACYRHFPEAQLVPSCSPI